MKIPPRNQFPCAVVIPRIMSDSHNIKVTKLFIADQRALTTREVSRIGAL